MTLADMIRKRGVGHRAKANPANLANEGIPATEPLATLATLAVANPPEPKTPNPTGELAAEEKAAVSRWWRIHYADRPPVEVVHAPRGRHDEILKWNLEATKVEPFYRSDVSRRNLCPRLRRRESGHG